MLAYSLILTLGAALFAAPSQAGDLSDLSGRWRTIRHGATVEVSDCGDGTPCGFLVDVAPETGGGKTHDENNHDPDLRKRSLERLPILWGFKPNENGWSRGRLYNPETGQTFRSSLELQSPDRLRVKGCLGPLCQHQDWIRINPHSKTESDLPYE